MNRIGLLGASSLVGQCLVPLLMQAGFQIEAYSRRPPVDSELGLTWHDLSTFPEVSFIQPENTLPHWICVAPIWVLPDYFDFIRRTGARKIVALSSTSRFTKTGSVDTEEQAVASRLAEGEDRLRVWASETGIDYVILRPTLIYGHGKDKNISEIIRFVHTYRFFPVMGAAMGLRQPIHSDDVAMACRSALMSEATANKAYNISGGEVLSYRDMVSRVFVQLGMKPRVLHVPLVAFRIALSILRCFPRYRHWSMGMVERMNQDLVFDHNEATRDFGFSPRNFIPSKCGL